MSNPEKVVVSVVGALIAHLLLLFAIALLLTFGGVVGPSESEAASEPPEVTIMLSDLIPEAPEEEPGKQYVRTDPDQQADSPPESARFESDRDTRAATQMLPDPTAEQEKDMPTIAGRDDLPALELRDRDFSEGDQIELPPPGSVASKASPQSQTSPTPPVPATDPAATTTADAMAADPTATPSVKATTVGQADADGERDTDITTEGKVESDVETDDEGDARDTLRPDAMVDSETIEKETQESFADPLAADDAPRVGRDEGRDDQDPSADREPEMVGSPADASAPTPGGSSASGESQAVGGAMAAASPATTPSQPSPDSAPQPGAATETPAFVPETRANEVSGTLSNIGKKAALDVEATALGRYKKDVAGAIEKQWHRFRLSNLDDITAGNLRLKFRVDSEGRVRNLKIVRNEANIGMTEFTLKAILTANIPAMPDDVASVLGSEGLIMNYTVLVVY